MQYQLKNGKFYRSTELSQDEVLELLNENTFVSEEKIDYKKLSKEYNSVLGKFTSMNISEISLDKLKLEDHDLGRPTSPNVKICKAGEEVEDGTPAVWNTYIGEWLYNWHGAMEECKYLGKRMPTDDELTELTPNGKEDIPNVVYAGYCSGGTCNSRGTNAYYWSASVYAPNPTNSWYRYLYYTTASVNRIYNAQSYAFSVRCIKN